MWASPTRATAEHRDVPKLWDSLHICPERSLVTVVRRAWMAAGSQRGDPARFPPVTGVVDVTVDAETSDVVLVAFCGNLRPSRQQEGRAISPSLDRDATADVSGLSCGCYPKTKFRSHSPRPVPSAAQRRHPEPQQTTLAMSFHPAGEKRLGHRSIPPQLLGRAGCAS
jgi:hypothetical protein